MSSNTVQSEYRSLFQPYRIRAIPAFAGSAILAAKRPRKVIGQKLWRHNFVFLQHPDTTSLRTHGSAHSSWLPSSGRRNWSSRRVRARPTYINSSVQSTRGYYTSWLRAVMFVCLPQAGANLQSATRVYSGHFEDIFFAFLSHSKCYVRPIQESPILGVLAK